jgi:exosortase
LSEPSPPIRVNAEPGRRLLPELALAAVAGAVIAVSPLVPKHWLGSLAAGIVTFAAVLAWRLSRTAGVAARSAAAPAPRIPPGASAVGALWVGLFATTWLWLYRHWTASVWSNEHGLFVPFLLAYLVHRTLRRDPEPGRAEASAWGLPLVALGAALAVLDGSVGSGYVATVGLLVTLPGLSLSLLGVRRTRALLVPLAASWLMLPMPRTLATDMQLRHITADAVERILDAVGYTVLREATVLHLPDRTFVVSDACSGFATLYAAASVAFVLACIARGNLRRAALLVTAPLLAIVANVVRVTILVVLTYHFGSWFIDSFFHPASGVATFVIVLFTQLAIAGQSLGRANDT